MCSIFSSARRETEKLDVIFPFLAKIFHHSNFCHCHLDFYNFYTVVRYGIYELVAAFESQCLSYWFRDPGGIVIPQLERSTFVRFYGHDTPHVQ